LLAAGTAHADSFRIATYAAPLSRDGPGLLLRDLQRGEDQQIGAVANVVRHVAPDVLVLTDFDYDLDGLALAHFASLFDDTYPYRFADPPNSGVQSGFDLDANGRRGDARDGWGYGRFAGDGGLAVLSRYPFDLSQMQDFTHLKWQSLPGATLPQTASGPFPSAEAQAEMRLSSTAHWVLPVMLPDGPPLSVLAFSATPPVFDGPEDANGLRNRDELRLWQVLLDGALGPVPESFVIAGNANLDPLGGDGLSAAMATFLADARLQDPLPGQATADWSIDGPGKLRVSYVLPAAGWRVTGAGVFWPATGTDEAASLGRDGLAAGPHHLVWVDISR